MTFLLLQKGCSFQKHSVPTTSSSEVYSILLQINDNLICTSDHQTTQNRPKTQPPSGPTGSSKEFSPLLYLLQKEKPRHHLPPHFQESSATSSIGSGTSGGGSAHDEPSVESVGVASLSGPVHLAFGSLGRQHHQALSHDLDAREDSELEEDEEEEVSGGSLKQIRYQQSVQAAAAANRNKKKTNVKQRQHTKG